MYLTFARVAVLLLIDGHCPFIIRRLPLASRHSPGRGNLLMSALLELVEYRCLHFQHNQNINCEKSFFRIFISARVRICDKIDKCQMLTVDDHKI